MPIRRLRMLTDMGVIILTPSNKFLNRVDQSQKYIKTGVLFIKLFEYIEDPENDQLAAFHGDLKRLTSLT